MPGPHDSRSIANRLIDAGLAAESPLFPLQTIKLVYFSHGWMLGMYGRPLSKHAVRAWLYGPMIPEVYRALEEFGGDPVEIKIDIPGEEQEFDELEADVIDQVYNQYGKLSSVRLAQIANASTTPWRQVWTREGMDTVIPDDLIEKHYKKQYDQIVLDEERKRRYA